MSRPQLRALDSDVAGSIVKYADFGEEKERGDLIETYKLMPGTEAVSCGRFFSLSRYSNARGHRYKLFKKQIGPWRQTFYSARAVDGWNELDEKTVSVETTIDFKKRLEFFGYWVM